MAATVGLTGFVVDAAADARKLAPLPDPPAVDAATAGLGGLLFFDPRLAGDTGNSCGSCHDPAKGWGDGKALSTGYTGVEHFRNSPALFNVAFRRTLTWDARLDGADLATLTRDMVTEAHTMNADTRLVQERLKQVPEYAEMFKVSFGGDPYGGGIYAAISEFLKTIRTVNAPLDKYLRGDQKALSPQQLAGKAVFEGKGGCIACHNGPMLSDGGTHALGTPENAAITTEPLRHITMLRHFASLGAPNFMNLREDIGAFAVTKDPRDRSRFATPSLWDVGQTGPYMHNGVFTTLEEVVEFYDRGGGEGNSELKPLGLSGGERQTLVAFLLAMTGDKPTVTPSARPPDYQLCKPGENRRPGKEP
ncbi:MAG: cytochrome-c peroxidase [Methylocystis sp.]